MKENKTGSQCFGQTDNGPYGVRGVNISVLPVAKEHWFSVTSQSVRGLNSPCSDPYKKPGTIIEPGLNVFDKWWFSLLNRFLIHPPQFHCLFDFVAAQELKVHCAAGHCAAVIPDCPSTLYIIQSECLV